VRSRSGYSRSRTSAQLSVPERPCSGLAISRSSARVAAGLGAAVEAVLPADRMGIAGAQSAAQALVDRTLPHREQAVPGDVADRGLGLDAAGGGAALGGDVHLVPGPVARVATGL